VTQTADLSFDASAGNFGHSVLELALNAALIDSFHALLVGAERQRLISVRSPIVFSSGPHPDCDSGKKALSTCSMRPSWRP
jgi:hypothetical protein